MVTIPSTVKVSPSTFSGYSMPNLLKPAMVTSVGVAMPLSSGSSSTDVMVKLPFSSISLRLTLPISTL